MGILAQVVYIQLLYDCKIVAGRNVIFIPFDVIDGEVEWKDEQTSKVSFRFFYFVN